MRPSNKRKILEAAIAIVEREGVGGVSYESVAEDVGMTKGGIMYHFPTRESLVLGMHELMATRWEDTLEKLAGKPANEATTEERLAAYVGAATTAASRVELLLTLEGVHNPHFTEPVSRVVERWTPPVDGASLSEREIQLLVARLASDGLWLLEAWTRMALPPHIKDQVITYVTKSISAEN